MQDPADAARPPKSRVRMMSPEGARRSLGASPRAAPRKSSRAANLELRAACEAEHLDLDFCRAALAEGASLEIGLTPFGSSALHIAAFDGKEELVTLFIEEGAPVDLRRPSEERDTPMILACQNGHVQVVELLADAGASIHIPDETGATPLFIASKNGHLEVVQMLIKRGAVVDAVAPGLRNNAPLAAAAYMGQTKVVRALLDAGANPEHKSSDSFTAEAHAKAEGHKKIADLLRRRAAQHGQTRTAQSPGADADVSEGCVMHTLIASSVISA